jgi:hypothetical protein
VKGRSIQISSLQTRLNIDTPLHSKSDTNYHLFCNYNIHYIGIKLTYSHSNSKIKKTLIDVARYKSLIEQSYSCTIRYFDRPDSFCELVTWPTNISDDTLAFLFNKCNLYYFIKNHIRREILSFFAF